MSGSNKIKNKIYLAKNSKTVHENGAKAGYFRQLDKLDIVILLGITTILFMFS